jgi:hypothetical protein
MSSFVGGTRRPDDYDTPAQDLLGNHLQYSTLHPDSRGETEHSVVGKKQSCLFCGKKYQYRPGLSEEHLDGSLDKGTTGKPRKVNKCSPTIQHIARKNKVVDELRVRRKAEAEREAEEGRKRKAADLDRDMGTTQHNPVTIDQQPALMGSKTRAEM